MKYTLDSVICPRGDAIDSMLLHLFSRMQGICFLHEKNDKNASSNVADDSRERSREAEMQGEERKVNGE